MAVPPNPDLPRVVSNPEFNSLVERVKRELQVAISPNFKHNPAGAYTNGNATADSLTDYSFKFRCQRSNSDFLITAREMLEQFLLNHNIHVYPSPTSHTHKRGDSFAEAFPHFDSKVLSAARTRGHGKRSGFHLDFSATNSTVSEESMDLSLIRSDVIGDRRLRLANSSPDVKALFNNPTYIYNLPPAEPEEQEANYIAGSGPGSEVDHWTPLPPIVRALSLPSNSVGLTLFTGYGGAPDTAQRRRHQAWLRLFARGKVEGTTGCEATAFTQQSCAILGSDLFPQSDC